MIKTEEQGAPIVNVDNVSIRKQCKDVVLLEVDLASKCCEVFTHSGKDIFISANDFSSHLSENVEREKMTVISLVGYEGWEIFLAEIARYTLRICLTRP